MKVKYLFLISVLVLLLGSCKDSDTNSALLELSQSSFGNISNDGGTLEVNISCTGSWTITTPVTWCNITPAEGTGNQKVTLSIDANLETTERTADIKVSSDGIGKMIHLSQNPAEADAGEYHYNLPVIFHVLYTDKNDEKQYVSQSRLAEILDVINKMYKDKSKSVDMNLTFKLVAVNPNGDAMNTPGVEYVQWEEEYPIDCDAFMSDESGKYVKYLWDPNKYINIMIYNFTKDDSGTTTLGISHIPFSTIGNTYLEGLNPVKSSYLTIRNLSFPYCASINSLFINEQSTAEIYNKSDITVTLAHELGHYLGLHHVFSENKNGDQEDSCEDTDYCEDTPSYNKAEYDMNYLWAINDNVPEDKLFAYLVKRTNCSGEQFTSYNIMDYAVSYSNQFTEDQRNRIRHVLTYSPLMPGPKKGQTLTRTAVDGVLDLPIRTVK